jgi:molybdopterin-guanine dinucleotide biosynthesis protein A
LKIGGELEAFILAGGKSRRFGSDKALFEIADEPLVKTLFLRLSPLFDRVRILAKSGEPYAGLGLEVLADLREEQCPLVGIYSGLVHLGGGRAFFTACDLPLVDTGLVRYVVEASKGYDAAVPRTEKGLEPLCAVYDVACLPAIESALSAGHLKTDSFLPDVRARFLDEKDLKVHDPRMISFWNVNTPGDMPFVIETIAKERAKRCS